MPCLRDSCLVGDLMGHQEQLEGQGQRVGKEGPRRKQFGGGQRVPK